MPAPSIIKRNAVAFSGESRLVGVPRGPGSAGEPASDGREPEISITRSEQAVEAIEVTCPCGRHLVLECLYDESPSDQEAPPAPQGD